MKRSLQDIIEIGAELKQVKSALPYGAFLPWLSAEFGWAERTARNLMAVAERFGRSEIISDLRIQPTAAYLLAAPSTPDEARKVAVARAESGEQITVALAKQIVAALRKRPLPEPPPRATSKLGDRLLKVLKLYRHKWDRAQLSEMACCLRQFAADLERRQRKPKRKEDTNGGAQL